MPAVPRVRLDIAVVDRGLAPSRERARALILAGRVRVDGTVVSKAGTPVTPAAAVDVIEPDFPWVGRGGVKLAHALDVVRHRPSTGAKPSTSARPPADSPTCC